MTTFSQLIVKMLFPSIKLVILSYILVIGYADLNNPNLPQDLGLPIPNESSLDSVQVRLKREVASFSAENQRLTSSDSALTSSNGHDEPNSKRKRTLRVPVTAIHVDRAEFPLNRLLFQLTLRLALDEANKYLEQQQQHQDSRWRETLQVGKFDRVELALEIHSATTCSRQFSGALAAEAYYRRRARLFVVSGCDDAIRTVSLLASQWQVPVMTAAGFGADLSNKRLYRTLIRVAFSFQSAVDFLFKILKSFHWRHVNLVVDESDTNSLALRDSVEKHLVNYQQTSASKSANFSVILNPISFDLQSLLTIENKKLKLETGSRRQPSAYDKWPTEIAEQAISDALWRCSRFSRVTIVLMGQRHLRKFMLSAYDQNMANGQYTFINMPLLQMNDDDDDDDDHENNGDEAAVEVGARDSKLTSGGTGGNSSSSEHQHAATRSNIPTLATVTGENEFLWRSPDPRARDAHAKQAFESLMSIYLRTPTTKAYVHLSAKVNNLAKEYHNISRPEHSNPRQRVRFNLNPYSASFHDSLLIYARALHESLKRANATVNSSNRHVHANVSERIRNRRYENMITGSVVINQNGDRETDFTLDDMNKMTGLFVPVILYRGETHDIERLGRIHWSSDSSVGPTGDSVECHLLPSGCGSFGLFALRAKSIIWLALLAGLLAVLLAFFYFLHSRLKLESQLVDYWWRIHMNEIEIINTLRKNLRDGSLAMTPADSEPSNSLVSSMTPADHYPGQLVGRRGAVTTSCSVASGPMKSAASVATSSRSGTLVATKAATTTRTEVTRVTDTSGAWSSAMDVCYGNITLATFRLVKVALKPIKKFHHSRKLMIELRGLKEMNHSNVCRFYGIIVDEGSLAIVNEFCPKGSLREFFCNESMVIDWTFKYSIINDILAGLNYLHSSPVGFHGRLKSSNCLVSGRFVIKLSDYGPHLLLDQQDDEELAGGTNRDDGLSKQWLKKRVLLAPEHMIPSRKICGSPSGDIYSFGLLLYEIITNTLPFYNSDKNDFDLPIEKLYNGLRLTGPGHGLGPDMSLIEQVPLSLNLNLEKAQNQAAAIVQENNLAINTNQSPSAEHPAAIRPLVDLMEACWQFDASKRPTLIEVNSVLRKITRGITSKKLLENLTTRMEQYTNNLESLVEGKLATLMEEKLKTEELLYQFVPKSIASRLREGQFVEPEAFECVTVFYSDIVGFTSLSSESSPMEVVDFLSDLYLCFDETLERHDIFKVDTIGDAYIVASGLPLPNEGKHVIEIARTALELRDRLKQFKIPHKPGRTLEMRVGIHSGPCVAGIVGGLDMPKYCVFGDTLTMGKFMESSGMPMRIHITDDSRRLLLGVAEFHIEPREPKITRDGLPIQTYWLERGANVASEYQN